MSSRYVPFPPNLPPMLPSPGGINLNCGELTTYKDVYHLDVSTYPTDVTIKLMRCGKPVETVETNTISVPGGWYFKFKYDGQYGIYLNDSSEPCYIVDYFEDTLKHIALYTELFLCGCNCSNCDDCFEESDCDLMIRISTLMMSYYMVTNPKYTTIFNIVSKKLGCDITADLLCQINNMSYGNDSDAKFFIKRLIAFMYLVFYLHESLGSIDMEEAEYVNKKFKAKKILACIKKLGINIEDIIGDITDDLKVYRWQFDETISDINTVISDWSVNYLDLIANRPLSDYEQGVTAPFTKVGRVCFAIKPSQLVNFSIYDSLGNDVTDEFDIHYFATEETVVFVSKIVYAPSNIFFKFKKNIYV